MWGTPSEDEAAPDALASRQPRSPDGDDDEDGDASLMSAQTASAPPIAAAAVAGGARGAIAPMDWAGADELLHRHFAV